MLQGYSIADIIFYGNNCKKDVLEKTQLEKKEVEYSIGKTLYAASNKGKRLKQEDSVIILEHPKNSEIKLIAVADGIGGHLDGDLASNYAIKRLIEWFEETTEEDHNDPSKTTIELSANITTYKSIIKKVI